MTLSGILVIAGAAWVGGAWAWGVGYAMGRLANRSEAYNKGWDDATRVYHRLDAWENHDNVRKIR
jgi:hypothetical protein